MDTKHVIHRTSVSITHPIMLNLMPCVKQGLYRYCTIELAYCNVERAFQCFVKLYRGEGGGGIPPHIENAFFGLNLCNLYKGVSVNFAS